VHIKARKSSFKGTSSHHRSCPKKDSKTITSYLKGKVWKESLPSFVYISPKAKPTRDIQWRGKPTKANVTIFNGNHFSPQITFSFINFQSHLPRRASLNHKSLMPRPLANSGCLTTFHLTRWNLKPLPKEPQRNFLEIASNMLATEEGKGKRERKLECLREESWWELISPLLYGKQTSNLKVFSQASQ